MAECLTLIAGVGSPPLSDRCRYFGVARVQLPEVVTSPGRVPNWTDLFSSFSERILVAELMNNPLLFAPIRSPLCSLHEDLPIS